MGKVLLIYKSNTGFTKKYAEWIQEEIDCKVIEMKEADISEVIKYDTIIFGGGMHANRINGIKFIKNNIEKLKDKNLIVFATGATPSSATEEVEGFKKINIPSGYNIHFYYFQSGMSFENMGIKDKMMINSYNFILNLKKNKTDVEQGTLEATNHSYDNSNKTFIKPLVDHIKNL